MGEIERDDEGEHAGEEGAPAGSMGAARGPWWARTRRQRGT